MWTIAALVACFIASVAGDCTMTSRAGWGARPPTSTSNIGTRLRYIVHHSAGSACTTADACQAQMRSIQNYHMDTNGWADIGYNFVVGEDGLAYEGRGWDNLGAHAGGHNTGSIGICVLGDFTSRVPSQGAQDRVKALMKCGTDSGFLPTTYKLLGHRDVTATACPGNTFYPVITGWPNYSPTP